MSAMAESAALVAAYNAMPRKDKSPSGMVPNHYHFSIRHVPLQPPGYMVLIVQPDSRYTHVEGPLPPSFESESTEVRAATIAVLLLKGFTKGLGGPAELKSRPWSLSCNGAELAGAVGEVLRVMGVTAPEGVGIADNEENKISDECWTNLFSTLQNMTKK